MKARPSRMPPVGSCTRKWGGAIWKSGPASVSATSSSRGRTGSSGSTSTYLVAAPDEFDAVVVDPGIEPIVAAAWFGADELRSLDEVVYPEGLAELIESALTDADS